MIHVADLAAALLAAANQEFCFGRTIEVRDASSAGYSMADVAAITEAILGRRVRRLPVPGVLLHASALLQQLVARISGRPAILSPGKVRELRHPDWLVEHNELAEVGLWQPQCTLESGLVETIHWYVEKGLLPPLQD